MIGTAAEEDHAVFVAVGFVEAHDLGPELHGAFDVAYLVDHVPEFVDLDGRGALIGFGMNLGRGVPAGNCLVIHVSLLDKISRGSKTLHEY